MYHGFIGSHVPGSRKSWVTGFQGPMFQGSRVMYFLNRAHLSPAAHAIGLIPASHLELRSPAGLLGAGPAQRVDVGHQLVHVQHLLPVLEGAAEVPGAPVLEGVEVPGAPVHGRREDVVAEADVRGPAHLGSDLHHRLLQAAQKERDKESSHN
jgi:hypothetical protein